MSFCFVLFCYLLSKYLSRFVFSRFAAAAAASVIDDIPEDAALVPSRRRKLSAKKTGGAVMTSTLPWDWCPFGDVEVYPGVVCAPIPCRPDQVCCRSPSRDYCHVREIKLSRD